MRTNIINAIFRKEIKEVLRDKRMLYLIILLPFFLYPVMFTLMGKVGQSQQEKMASQEITVLLSPQLEKTPIHDALAQSPEFKLRFEVFDKAKLDTMSNVIGIQMDTDFNKTQAAYGTIPIQILADQSKDLLQFRSRQIKRMLDGVNQNLLKSRLDAAELNPEFATPLAIEQVDLASKQQQAGKIMASFLPMIILLFVFVGCVYIAIDITAGEKERKTLQTIFTAPIKTGEIIAGKFAAVFMVGIVSAFMNILSLVVAMMIQVKFMGGEVGNFSLTISPQGWLWMVIIIFLTTVFIAALTLSVVLLANSYKEAQSYVSPLMMLIIIPAVLSQMPGMELNSSTALVPMLNISLGIGAVLKGSFSTALVATVASMALIYALLALFFASQTFSNENVVTGEKIDFKSLFSLRKS
ncbi:MAG: ABC transporter permease [Saprospiraceae bacterium]